ncbi:helix-turn-helix domain-containing protein [Ideonella sp.]|jgi:AraC family ethanolamine operon transcriptional activator|uniref:helix-turn-helix domain-containing protein n=1 Tax=Ideonella sp. TaxID=1929293 RepID=UPI0037BFAEB5
MGATPALLSKPSQLHLVHFDPHGMSGTLQGSQLEHVQMEPGQFHGVVAQMALDTLGADWGAYSLSVLAQGLLSPDRVSLGMVIRGEGEWRVRGQPACNGDLVMLPEGGELTVSLPSESQWVALQIPRQRLEALGLPLEGLKSQGGWHRGSTSAGLQQAVSELASLVMGQAAPQPSGVPYEQWHEHLLGALTAAWMAGVEREQHGETLSSRERWRVVQRAESYITACSDPTVRLDEVCLAAGTSLSRLERAFREAYGHGPRRTLTLRRMAAVRRELMQALPGTSVTEVATRWGFSHLGRFAQDYASMYQERPSATLQRSRLRH